MKPKGTLPRADVLIHPRIPIGINGSHAFIPLRRPVRSWCRVQASLGGFCKKHCGSAKVTEPLRDFLLDAVAPRGPGHGG